MRKQERKTQPLTISDVGRRLSRIVADVSRSETRVVIEKRGIPAAAIVPIDDLERRARMGNPRGDACPIP